MSKKDILKRIGKNIKAIRKANGITQEGFAEKMNVSWSYVAKVENGYLNMSIGKLYDISDYLDVDLSEILKLD